MKIVSRPLMTSAGQWLLDHFADPSWSTFRCAVAFIKQSGTKYFAPALYDFTRRDNNRAYVTVGISSRGTSLEGVQDTWRVLEGYGDVYIMHEGPDGRGAFHPKFYAFQDAAGRTSLLIGSANLTEGGLFTNHEASIALDLNAADTTDSELTQQVSNLLDAWQTPSPSCVRVNPELIKKLYARGDLPSEAALRILSKAASAKIKSVLPGGDLEPGVPSPFGSSPTYFPPKPRAFPTAVPPPPVLPSPTTPPATIPDSATDQTATPATEAPRQFFIEVRPHHNGEVFLSYRAISDDPSFFHWPFTGWTVPKRAGNQPYPQLEPDPVVEILVYDSSGSLQRSKPLHPLNVVYYESKREIRITLPDGMQREIPELSLLVMTKEPTPALDYRLEFFPPGAIPPALTTKLTQSLPSGGATTARRYGWS